MDVNADGFPDLLSGSYSRHDADMAGLFYVLPGRKDRTFGPPEALKGSDGALLLVTPRASGEEGRTDRICTRPTAVDLDGDGKLDLVAGNFSGIFAFFRGEGEGKFDPKNRWLESGGRPLAVQAHSDPFFIDWDRDGDLDLLSGSSEGGVFLFENAGTANAPSFRKATTLVKAPSPIGSTDRYGDAHLTGPQSATRVWADDVDGDGKLDLLVGDTADLRFLGEGVTPEEAKTRLAAWMKKRDALYESALYEARATDPAKAKEFDAAWKKLLEERDLFLREENTGFIWLLRGK